MQKGKSNNPSGKKSAFTIAIRELAECEENAVPESWGKKRTEAQGLAERVMSLAKAGSPQHLAIALDRMEGKAPMAPEDRDVLMANGTGIARLLALFGEEQADGSIAAGAGRGDLVSGLLAGTDQPVVDTVASEKGEVNAEKQSERGSEGASPDRPAQRDGAAGEKA